MMVGFGFHTREELKIQAQFKSRRANQNHWPLVRDSPRCSVTPRKRIRLQRKNEAAVTSAEIRKALCWRKNMPRTWITSCVPRPLQVQTGTPIS